MTGLGFEPSPLAIGVGLLVLAALIAIPFYLLRTRVIIVPEGQQVVVCQLGRFNRVAGPGPVVLNRNLDTVERTLDVRNQPANYRVDGLFSYGIPFGYTLNFWSRTDLNAAAGGDREQLRRLALFEDRERRTQVQTILRKTLVQTLANLGKKYTLGEGAGWVDRLLPVLPGIPRCEELLTEVQNELQRSLPAVGVIVDMQQPLVIQAVHLGSDIVESFSRGRRIALLREQWPKLTEEMLLQAFSAVEGLEHLPRSYFVLDTGAAATAKVELRPEGEEFQPKVKVQPAPAPAEASPVQGSREAAPRDPGEESLSAEDLKVLKRIPPSSQERRTAG